MQGHATALRRAARALLVVSLVVPVLVGPAARPAAAVAPLVPADFLSEVVITNLEFIATMELLPDGKILLAELGGTIKVVPAGSSVPNATPFNAIPDAMASGDAGLLDMVIDPNFASNGYYYVFYYIAPGMDRLSRFTAAPGWNTTVAGSELVLWQDQPGAVELHHGGALAFGPDGKLYVSIGDHWVPNQAQPLTSPYGKILRLNSDGSVPTDGPFYDGAGPNVDSIWARGFREPFRMSFDRVTGRLYVGDLGDNDPATSIEELDLVTRGANYGWPICEASCTTPQPGLTNPIYSYAHNGTDASVVGGFVYRGTQFPAALQGAYFFGDYAQNWIRYLTLDSNGLPVGPAQFFSPTDGTLDDQRVGEVTKLMEAADGSVYYLDLNISSTSLGDEFNEGTLRRVRYVGNTNVPPTAQASADRSTGPAPLTVAFSSAGSVDPEGVPLTYAWDFGDGATSSAANPTHTFDGNGSYQVALTVSDGVGTGVARLTITVGNPPVATILSPANGTTFRAGATISATGSGTDADDGTLPATAFQWQTVFHHETHVHPGTTASGSTSFAFTVPASGHDFSGATSYEIILTVTDSDGLQHSASVFVYPEKVSLSFATVPSGLTLTLDGVNRTAPFVFDSLIGFNHTLGAPAQSSAGVDYTFTSWSDGGAQSHTVVVPTQAASFTATFAGAAAGPSRDEFTSTTLNPAWTFLDTRANSTWSLSANPGHLRVTVPAGQYHDCWGPDLSCARMLRPLAGDGAYEMKLDALSLGLRYQDVGIFFQQDNNNFVRFELWSDGTRVYANADRTIAGNGSRALSGPAVTVGPSIWIRVTKTGTTYTMAFSGNGTTWTTVGSFTQAGFTPSQVGIHVGNDGTNPATTANVDYFQLPGPADTQPPTAPTNLQAPTVTYNAVGLSWGASSDNVAVTGYNVYRGGTRVGATTATTFTDTTVSPLTSYTYTVRAVDGANNEGPASNQVAVTTPAAPDTSAPTTPTNFTATTATAPLRVNLAWTASTDNVGVVKYVVRRGGVTLAEPTTTSYTDGTVTSGVTYTYTVAAVDAANNSSPTASVTVTPSSDATAPSASITSPAGGAVVSGAIAVAVTAADNVGVTRVELYVDTTNLVGTDTTAPYTVTWDTTTATNTSHTLTAKAFDAAGNSATSAGVAVTVNNTGPPGDEFTSTTLNPAWTFLDTRANSTWSLSANPGHLRVTVPAGQYHDCWGPDLSCARMLRPLAGDGAYEMKLDALSLGLRYQDVGIFFQQDNNNFVRFELWSDGTRVYANADRTVAGNGSRALSGPAVTVGPSVWIRVTKTGTTYTMAFSGNGTTWTTVGSFTQAGFTPSQVGIHVGNDGTNPTTTANIDYFHTPG